MTKTRRCTASVWPHRHTDELTGPLDLKISYRNQPQFVQDWCNKRVWIYLEQPDDQTNLTIITLSFGGDIYPCHLARASRRGQDKSLKIYLKSRLTNQMEHPIPRGQWQGTYKYTDTWCTYTFQAMTAKVVKKKSIIILPGEDGLVLP